jgi:hypothetical protein
MSYGLDTCVQVLSAMSPIKRFTRPHYYARTRYALPVCRIVYKVCKLVRIYTHHQVHMQLFVIVQIQPFPTHDPISVCV